MSAALNIPCGGCSGPSSLAVASTTKHPESRRGEPLAELNIHVRPLSQHKETP